MPLLFYYETGDTNAFNTYATASTMAGALLSTLTTGTLTGGEGGTISSTTVSNLLGAENYAIYDAMKDSITDRNYPRVYLNYLSFDESFNILPEECSITQMKGPDHVWNMLTQPGYICRKNGYVLAYVSNESDVVTFIDNTTFTIHYGQLQQEQHYYPHGLVLDAGLATGALKSNYLFEGNELQPHLNLQLSDFNYRQYDQQIGRFTSIDPLADQMGQEMFSPYHFVGNDPANSTDPLGLGTDSHGTSTNLLGPGGSLGMNIKVWYQNSWAKAMMSAIASFMSAAAGIAGDGISGLGDLFDGISFGGGQPGSGNSGSFSTSFTPPSPPAGKSAVAPVPTPGLVNGISGGGGKVNTIAQREANAQNAANVKAYKEDMARNYAGSGHQEKNKGSAAPKTQGKIYVYRMIETNKSTISKFTTDDGSVNGYILEPAGPSTTTPNMDKRIPSGEYSVTPHVNNRLHSQYQLYNDQVSRSRAILIHIGNGPDDTEGCLLPGSSISADHVWGSGPVLNQINKYIRSHDANVKIIIFDPVKP